MSTARAVELRNMQSLVSRLTPLVVAVVHPCDEDSLRGTIEATHLRLIVPILIGTDAPQSL